MSLEGSVRREHTIASSPPRFDFSITPPRDGMDY